MRIRLTRGGMDGKPKVCDGCGETYWEELGCDSYGLHYQMIREEGRDEESGSTGAKT